MSEGSDSAWAFYSNFRLKSETTGYTLEIGGYWSASNAPDSLTYHNRAAWSSKNQDSDYGMYIHCARAHKGAFWYKNCNKVNPLGQADNNNAG